LDFSLEYQIGDLLRARGWKLAVAESCTGGLVGHRITNVPGSSEYYLGSVTAYAYEAKERLLGVRHETLERYGAVSEETVLEMARGVCAAFGAQVGVSITGIAGPGGAMPGKPVGLVWIGMSAPDGDWAWRYLWSGNREENKSQSAEEALRRLVEYLGGKPPEKPDTIEVRARWDEQGRAWPLEFTWQGKRWQVSDTGRRWQDDRGEHILGMVPGGQVFEFVYRASTGQWSLGFVNAGRRLT